MNFVSLLILVVIAGVVGGSVVYVLGPVQVVIPENVIIRRQGHVPLWVDDELIWVEENRVFILSENVLENVRPRIIFPDNVFKVTIYRWPLIVVENIAYEVCYAIKPVGTGGGCQRIDNIWIFWF